MLAVQKHEDQQIHAYSGAEPVNEYRPVLSNQPYNADQYKRREVMQEQNTLFDEGVDCYEHKKYTQAKLLFGELADQHDHRAEVWLKKVDHAITQQLLGSEEAEERERTAFIEDQLKAQRELNIIQERERQRQKKLTEELERQRRLYEDDRLLQLRKEETMKAQERERQRQEEKRLRLEKEKEKQQETLRFHKINVVVHQPIVKPPDSPIVPKPMPVVAPAPPVVPVVSPAIIAKRLEVQKEQERQAKIKATTEARQKREEERQKERKHQQELRTQREAERQAKIKAAAEARQKREEERQKERDRQQALKAQREAERQAKLKVQEQAKIEEAQARAEKLAQEQKRREELIREQEEQRQEKIKQAEIIREEDQRRQDLEQQERQSQIRLEAQREAVHKQLVDGVEAMYQEALGLYKQGDYAQAADRFKDVQDILPGYKNSEQYMDDARQKSLAVGAQPVAVVAPTTATTTSASAPVSHQNNVSKALDIFDPNAK